MSSVVFVALVVLMPAALHGQVVEPERDTQLDPADNVFGLGFSAGPASGVGLSFRHHFPSRFSYQIAGGVIKGNRVMYDFGGEVQFDVSRTHDSRYYVALSMAYFYSGKDNGNEMEGPGRAGLGIGGEFPLASGLHGNIDAIFTYFTDGTVLPLPHVGLHYYFR